MKDTRTYRLAMLARRQILTASQARRDKICKVLILFYCLLLVLAMAWAGRSTRLARRRREGGSAWFGWYLPMMLDRLRPGVEFRKELRLKPAIFMRICDAIRQDVEYL
jgi:hypothetical protein